jgi:hypothetical protein
MLALTLLVPADGIAEGETGPVVVEVRGRGGRLLEGVDVYGREGETWKTLGTTGADGTLTVPHGPGSFGRVFTASASRFRPSRGDPRRGRVATAGGPRVSLSIDCGADVVLDVVDAETGTPLLDARWRVVWRTANDPKPGDWVPAGTPAFYLVGWDGREIHGFEVGGLEGYGRTHAVTPEALAEAMDYGWQHPNRARSTVLRGVVPVRRVLRLRARATTPEGKPVGVRRASWRFVGAPDRPAFRGERERAEPERALELELPWFCGARVAVEAWDPLGGVAFFDMPRTLGEGEFDVRVPVSDAPPEDAELTGPISGGLFGVGGGGEPPDPKGVTLEVTVLQADGTPRAEAEVELESLRRRDVALPGGGTTSSPLLGRSGFTDASGRVRFDRLPPGGYAVDVSHPDALPAHGEVRLDRRGETVPLVLKEPVGATVDVTVTDATGAALPFAAVTARGPLDGSGGLGEVPLRLHPYTDVRGRRTIRRVDPGAIRLKAWFGPLQGEAVVDVADGATVATKVVVRQPD